MKKNSILKLIIIIAAIVEAGAIVTVLAIINNPSRRLTKLLDLGNRYLEVCEYDQAIAAFEGALEIDPNCVEAYLGEGKAYVGLGEYDQAIAAYEGAIGIDSMSEEAYLGIVEAYILQGDFEKALEYAEAGYEKTGDERLKKKIDRIYAEQHQDGTVDLPPSTNQIDWQAAYLSFLDALDAGSVEIEDTSGELMQNTLTLQKGSDDNLFSLVDINLDGIPELIWDEVSAVEIFHFLSCDGGVVRQFEGAGRGALGWEVVWQVKDTPYYITEHDTGISYEWYLCTIQDGSRKALLSIAIMSNDAFEYYQYPLPCYDADENEITEQELQSRFRELTGYSIGNLATDQEYHMHFGEEPYLVSLCDSETMFSEEEIRKQLGGEAAENAISKEDADANPWKTAYQNCLSDIISGKTLLLEDFEAISYSDTVGASFALSDLTQDGMPELLVALPPSVEYPAWNVFTALPDGNYQYMGMMNYYNPETMEAYYCGGSVSENYSVYSIEGDTFVLKYEMSDDWEAGSCYRGDANYNYTEISDDEMNAFRATFQSGWEKYGLSGEVLSKENISKILAQ